MPSGIATTITPIKISVGGGKYKGDLGAQLDALEADFKWYCDQFEGGMAEVLLASLEPTFEITQQRVPVKTGELKASGYLVMEKFRGQPRVEIGYGRSGYPDYAITVHEDPTPKHQPPTSYKYLQGPIDEDWGNITTRIAQNAKLMSGLGSR